MVDENGAIVSTNDELGLWIGQKQPDLVGRNLGEAISRRDGETDFTKSEFQSTRQLFVPRGLNQSDEPHHRKRAAYESGFVHDDDEPPAAASVP